MTTIAYILDTETTGNDASTAQAIEVAHISLDGEINYDERFKPSVPFMFGAMATHNIIEQDLMYCKPVGSYKLPSDCEYMIGHNIDFDWEVIGKPDVKRIDTLSLSRVIWPDDDSHTQLACLYRIDPVYAQSVARDAHGAAADIQMTKVLFEHMQSVLGTEDLEVIHGLIDLAKVPTNYPIGKYRGQKIVGHADKGYVEWFKKQPGVDAHFLRALNGEEGLTLERAQAICAAGKSTPTPR